ncbi:lipase family protein [Bdellovibrio svalbardensis]|uniref:DUF72 domain-containing protein n=1 Tax=Bdellovibrio svalbardensis TaxID=2972972 RepID=A0ABT6DKS4_9BACT|nr:hypothetical protein [Bdellovibrio svalbardensis]MDG0817463.1 hypothetical protein [Bdellovibrio svalbardensis]
MDVLLIVLSLFVFTVALAVFSNRTRARKEIPFELHPNCLLTRWPLLFVTGPRSFFYFDTYWNGYTSYLAEHGYEVFKLQLPWNKSEYRQKRFLEFLTQQESLGRKFHLFVDSPTYAEMETLLRTHKFSSIISLTEITAPDEDHFSNSLKALPFPFATVETVPSRHTSVLSRLTYGLHVASLTRFKLPSLSTLGACEDTALLNGRLLLERANTLAETDLRD